MTQKDQIKIENFIGRISSFKGGVVYSVFPNKTPKTKLAITVLEVLERCLDYSLVKLYPITGRTHQLRVHMKYINHPILGDVLYSKRFRSKKEVSRLMLHSLEIEFLHPETLEEIVITSKIPKSFEI